MKIHGPSESPLTDSPEYKLINTTACSLRLGLEKLVVAYTRGEDIAESEVTFQAMDESYPGLSKTIILLFHQSSDADDFAQHVRATCSYLFGSFIDLNKTDGMTRTYTYMTNICAVSQCDDPGVFLLEGLCYRLAQKNMYGIHMVEFGAFHTATLLSESIERLWPGSSTTIPVMNHLGYSNVEIVKTLLESHYYQVSDVHVELPKFD